MDKDKEKEMERKRVIHYLYAMRVREGTYTFAPADKAADSILQVSEREMERLGRWLADGDVPDWYLRWCEVCPPPVR